MLAKNTADLYFNPGCALSIYKPEKERQILQYLQENFADVKLHKTCCRHKPKLPDVSTIINVCAGCDRRFSTLYEGIQTVSLWEVIDALGNFPLPDYQGREMSIHDACPVRNKPAVHQAVRNLLKKMDIKIVEAAAHGTKSVCCGDGLYPACSIEQIQAAMKKRADSMPCEHVAVYCVSCIKALHIGKKQPQHLVDLLFAEATEPQECDIQKWHEELEAYIAGH